MKKLFALLLALVLCAGCLTVSAEDVPAVVDMPVAGLELAWPRAFTEAKGYVYADGVYGLYDGVYYAILGYTGANAENPDELLSGVMFYTFSVPDDKELSETLSILSACGLDAAEDDMVLLGEAGSWKFYLYPEYVPDFAQVLGAEYADEYTALCGMKDDLAAAFTCSVPFNEYGDLSGRTVRFETTDLDGNPVSSEDLFGRNKVTMVNIWATWCGYCLDEMSLLEEIHTRNADKGCGVVGILDDTDLEAARKIVEEYGITYPVVIVPDGFNMRFPYNYSYPTTFYVDQNGTFLETKFVGAYPEMYEDVLLHHLEEQ